MRFTAPALWRDGELGFLDMPEEYPERSAEDDFQIFVSMGGLSDDGAMLARFSSYKFSDDTQSPFEAFLHNGSGWTKLELPSDSDEDASVSVGAMSANGLVVGQVTSASGMQIVVWSDGTPEVIDLTQLHLGDLTLGRVQGINSAGTSW